MRLDPDIQLILVGIGAIAAIVTIWGWLRKHIR